MVAVYRWILLGCLTLILILIICSVFLFHSSYCENRKEENSLDLETNFDIVDDKNMKINRGKGAFARDYGAQLSISNEMRSKETSRAIIEKIDGLHSMKKTNWVRKVIELERQLNVYSSNGFVSIKDVKQLAKKEYDEENKKLREEVDSLEVQNELLRSKLTKIEKLLEEKEKFSSSDYKMSLNRSVEEIVEVNSTLDCTNPFQISPESRVTQEEEKIATKVDIPKKKSFQKLFNIFDRQNSKKQLTHDKPETCEEEKVKGNPLIEDERGGDKTNPFIVVEDGKEEPNNNPFIEDKDKNEAIESSEKIKMIQNSNLNLLPEDKEHTQMTTDLLTNPFWSDL